MALPSHRGICDTDDATIETSTPAVLVETLRELANLVAAALVLAQFIGQQPLSLGLFLAGVAAWFTLVGLAMLFAGGER